MNLQEFLTGIGFFAKYPYTDFHELNLDWCLAQVAKLRVEFDDFAHVNSLKYAGEWDITKAYSAFSVVDDHGFGYMALKPVPPGTQINDTEYWLMVVDYSQITIDYENRITALETTVGDASSGLVKDVDDLQTDVSALQGTVGDASSGLVKDVDDLQTAVSGMSSDIDLLTADFTVMLTDSFGLNVTPNISTLVPSMMGWDASNSFVHTVGGCGFSSLCPFTYLNELTTQGPSIAALVDASKVTRILVTGGSNDTGYGDSIANIVDAIETFMNYCKVTYPNAEVVLAFTGWTIVSASADWNPTHFREVLEAWSHVTDFGGTFLHRINAVMHIESSFTDTVHPTVTAQVQLARAITNALKTGSAEIHASITPNFTPAAGVTISTPLNLIEKIDNDQITVRFNNSTLPSPRVEIGTVTIAVAYGEPEIHWIGTVDDTVIGNAGAPYIIGEYQGLFTSTEYSHYMNIQVVLQYKSIGIRFCDIADGTYTNAGFYLPTFLDILSNIYNC